MERTIKKEFLRYVSLNILSMLGISYYILVDTYFIGNGVGADGLTALNLAIPIFCIQQAFSFLFSVGLGTKYAILKAQNQQEEANLFFTNGWKAIWVVGILFSAMIFVFSHQIAYLMGARGDMIEMAAVYTRTCLMFTTFFLLNATMSSVVKNDGNPKLAMVAMLLGSFSNVVLDYVFIMELKWGMFGAALATGIAPIVGLSILSIHIVQKKNKFHLVKTKLKIRRVLSLWKLGLTAAVTELASGIVVALFNITILSITGDIGIAAYGVVANLAIVVLAMFNGIAQGIQPLISSFYGKHEYENMWKVLRYAIITTTIVAVGMYSILYVFASPIVEIFNGEHLDALRKIAVPGVKLYFSGIFFCGYSIVIAMYFNSRESVKNAFCIAVLRGGVVIAPVLLFLVSAMKLGMTGVWLSFPISEILVLMVVVLLLQISRKS